MTTEHNSKKELQELRERLNKASGKLSGLKRSVNSLREKQKVVLRELRLKKGLSVKDNKQNKGAISSLTEYISDIRDILEMMKTTFQKIYETEEKLSKKIFMLEEAITMSNENIMGTIERYRILSQLGELDSKILSLKLAGVPMDPELPEKVLNIRNQILTNEEINIRDLQKKALHLFRVFAENIEQAIDSMSYQSDKREILETMRDVSWM